jgi:DNA polymerase-4
MERLTGCLVLSVRSDEEAADNSRAPRKWSNHRRLVPVQDSFGLLAALDDLWVEMTATFSARRYRQVAVTLLELSPVGAVQLGRFDAPAAAAVDAPRKLALSQAMDRVNARFGRDAVTVGHDARGGARSKGPAIAFTRIPELAEFHE